MTIPDYQSLMLPLLKQAARGETRVPEVADKLADDLEEPAEERDQLLPSGRQKILHNRIHWSKLFGEGTRYSFIRTAIVRRPTTSRKE
jgi:restriction system protein